MRSIDGLGLWTQIWTQISGKTGHMASRDGETGKEGEIAGTHLIVGSRHSLTQSDEDCEWRDRRDSNPKSTCSQVVDNHELKELSNEQWTQIWTQISDEDRQMLSRIVERWGILSEELKRAVLRVVG